MAQVLKQGVTPLVDMRDICISSGCAQVCIFQGVILSMLLPRKSNLINFGTHSH